MIIDDVKIKVYAGKGGDGCAAFNKNMNELGPTGGSGGNGGSIYAIGVSELDSLKQFRYKKDIKAEKGRPGRPQFMDGSSVDDTYLRIPIGTVIYNLDNNYSDDMITVNQKIVLAKGGKGGRGNFLFRSATNTTPKQFGLGTEGETFNIRFELKMIADIGLVGLPNAGKSSLINEVTKANSKVANYPFTTLEAHLGVFENLIIADIPGLIEGASQNKGLGFKFLKHIERTKIIFHLIDSSSENVLKDYETIQNELKTFNQSLVEKEEYIILTKTDMADKAKLEKDMEELKKLKKTILTISIYDYDSLLQLKDLLYKINNEKIKKSLP